MLVVSEKITYRQFMNKHVLCSQIFDKERMRFE